jgi:hypothetical protein
MDWPMTADPAISDSASIPRSSAWWGLRGDVVWLWGLFCACYWLYPLWPRGNVSVHAKFAVLTVYTVGYLVLLKFWNRPDGSAAKVEDRTTWRSAFSSRWGLVSLGVVLVAAGLQFRETLLPILSGPDEPYRIAAAIDQWTALSGSGAGLAITILALASPILVWMAGLILLSDIRPVLTRLAVGCGALAVGFALNHQTMLELGGRWGGSPRWPPLGTLFEVFSLSLFGLNEAAVRLPSLIFFVLTGVLLFVMVARESTPLVGFVAVVSILSSPAFFTQGQLASRETMGAFFMTAAAYFLVRRWHDGRIGDLGWAITMTLAAYLTRRPAIAFFAVIVVVEAVRVWRGRTPADSVGIRPGVKRLLLGGAVFVAAALPWMFSTRTIRPFELSPGNWLDWGLIVAYPSRVPIAMGLVVTLFGLLGIVSAAVHRRAVAVVALLWVAIFFALFTSDTPTWIPTWRFLALMCPAWALLVAEGFRSVHDQLSSWARAPIVTGFVIGAVVSVVMWASCGLSPSWLSGAPCRDQIPRYPFDQVVAGVGATGAGDVLMSPATYWQTSLDVYAAFQAAGHLNEYVPPYGSPAPPLTVSDVKGVCRSEPVDFIVVPYERSDEGWTPKFMEPEQAHLLASELDPGSLKRAVFSRERFRLMVFPCPPK